MPRYRIRRVMSGIWRRYGRSARLEAGVRPIDELLEKADRPTVRAPALTMREQVEHDKRLRQSRERGAR